MMLVGEQPGDREDLAGRQFAGPAGCMLDDALESAGIDRAELYVTNAPRPPLRGSPCTRPTFCAYRIGRRTKTKFPAASKTSPARGRGLRGSATPPLEAGRQAIARRL
jgi:hypothetical protein